WGRTTAAAEKRDELPPPHSITRVTQLKIPHSGQRSGTPTRGVGGSLRRRITPKILLTEISRKPRATGRAGLNCRQFRRRRPMMLSFGEGGPADVTLFY